LQLEYCNWNIACKCENSDWKNGQFIDNPENPECGYLNEQSKTPIGWIPINLHYINVGDIVEEKNHSQEAPTAVVVSMNPFTLVCTKLVQNPVRIHYPLDARNSGSMKYLAIGSLCKR